MKLIVGLGNPDQQYLNTRHNVGFIVVDALASAHKFSPWQFEKSFQAELAKGSLLGEDCHLLKPMTYMNLSGKAVSQYARYFKVDPKDIIAIYDEMDLEPGKVKARIGGGAGGHNGVRSLIADLGSADFARVKVGVGKPPQGDGRSWVLGKLTKDELEHIDKVVINEVLLRIRQVFLQAGVPSQA